MNRKMIIHRMVRNKFFVVGFTLALIIILLSVFSPWIIRYDPLKNSLKEKLVPPDISKGLNGHIFGTDQMGRDIFSRLLIGSRFSLRISITVVIFQLLIGTVLGLLSGYFGGIIDAVIMRLCDFFLAVPNMVLAIAIMAVLGSNTFNLIFVLTITGWVQYCRVTRNNVMVVKKMEFVQASTCLGSSHMRIMFDQILPNVTTQLIILGSQKLGEVILLEAALSFLSLGIQPPTPSWGNMISAGRQYLAVSPWMVFAPGVALMLTVLAFNFLGDGLRDVLDPKLNN